MGREWNKIDFSSSAGKWRFFLGEVVADNHEQQDLQSAYCWYYYKKEPTITFLLSLGLTMNSPSLCH